jgi:hypothetical protein
MLHKNYSWIIILYWINNSFLTYTTEKELNNCGVVRQQTGHDNKLRANYLEFEGVDTICKVKEGTCAVRSRDKRKVFLLMSMDPRIEVTGLLSIILEGVMCILLKERL